MMKKLVGVAALTLFAMPFTHPFGPVRKQHASAALPGDASVRPLLERACQNCHSEKTEWPLYSYVPLASWALEKDVAEARGQMNLSRWEQYSSEQKQDLLARIGTEVRNHRMPLPRYVLLHSEARLSDEEIQRIYDWTRSERRALKNGGNK